MTELLEKYRRFYGEELGYTDEMIVEEIIADAYAGLERVPGTNMQQLQETVREWSAELQGYIDSGWYNTLSQDIEEEFRQSINGTRGPPTENAEGAESAESTENAEVRYSIAEDFESKCLQIEDGTLNREENPFIYVSATTPKILIDKAGAQNLPIIISYESLYLAVRSEGDLTGHYHNLGANAAEKIVEGLADPDEIIELQNGRINAVIQIEDESGRSAVASVELAAVKDFQGKNNAYNLILTMFEPRGNYLNNVRGREGNEVVYKKENQTETSQVNPRLNELSGTVNEEPAGSGSSVPYDSENVKPRYSVADATGAEETEQIIRSAQEYFGTTNDWNETGYLTRDGKQLDFSGGAAGNRYVDHREILDAYESAGIDDGMSGVEAMVDFHVSREHITHLVLSPSHKL